jgi:hypothetical protein
MIPPIPWQVKSALAEGKLQLSEITLEIYKKGGFLKVRG